MSGNGGHRNTGVVNWPAISPGLVNCASTTLDSLAFSAAVQYVTRRTAQLFAANSILINGRVTGDIKQAICIASP